MSGPWRTGRKLGRSLYVQRGDQPDCGDGDPATADVFVGIMDTSALAREVCEAMNHWFRCDCLEDCAAVQGVRFDADGQVIPVDDQFQPPRSVGPDDDCAPVVAVDRDGGVDTVPQDGGPVLPAPAEADLPVVPLDPLGDRADPGYP